MSHNDEFDELARRKLEERQVAFQEADWQAARKLIDAERGGSKRAAWITGALLLLLISGPVWYGTGSAGPEEAVASAEHAVPRTVEVPITDQQVRNSSVTGTETPPKANEQAAATEVKAPSIKTIPEYPADLTPKSSAATMARVERSTPRGSVEMNIANGVQPTAVPSRKNAAHTEQADRSIVKTNEAITSSEITGSAFGVQAATPSLADAGKENVQAGTIDPEAKSTQQNAFGSNATPSTLADQRGEVILQPGNNNANDEPIATEFPTPTVAVASKTAPTSIVPTETPVQPNAGTASSFSDTTSVRADPTTPPGDSAAAAAVVVTPAPLVPERAPWEVSIMGGMSSSSTKYAGSNSADWNADISKENSIAIGAELMHMGRNFGIGTGLDHSTYAEQLRMDAMDRSSTILQNFWYLMPVDTTILVITDTIAGTPPTFTGTSQSTTVNVLLQGTDTVTTMERIREARAELNRVSYLEVPLLLDAHLVQGRWSFGVRCGPTIGLLAGRRGTVPSPDNEGYVSFTDQPFRELVFGYTARAYVRYRFNAAWSVGIEPAMRGQLMNSLGSGELSRKATAKGVMLSLSYRLR